MAVIPGGRGGASGRGAVVSSSGVSSSTPSLVSRGVAPLSGTVGSVGSCGLVADSDAAAPTGCADHAVRPPPSGSFALWHCRYLAWPALRAGSFSFARFAFLFLVVALVHQAPDQPLGVVAGRHLSRGGWLGGWCATCVSIRDLLLLLMWNLLLGTRTQCKLA